MSKINTCQLLDHTIIKFEECETRSKLSYKRIVVMIVSK